MLRLYPEINGLVQGMIPMILGFQWFLEVAPWIYPDPQPTFQSSKQPKGPSLSHEQCSKSRKLIPLNPGWLNSGSQNIGFLESPRKMKGSRIYPQTNHQSTRGLGHTAHITSLLCGRNRRQGELTASSCGFHQSYVHQVAEAPSFLPGSGNSAKSMGEKVPCP